MIGAVLGGSWFSCSWVRVNPNPFNHNQKQGHCWRNSLTCSSDLLIQALTFDTNQCFIAFNIRGRQM